MPKLLLKKCLKLFLLLTCIVLNASNTFSQIKNFNKNGGQVTRFSTLGNAIDAHDGEIAYFGNTYYLYGTSYDCGFQWGNKGAPFCGFKVYSSKDLNSWADRGYLFDANTPVWQTRCDGKTYGCFRPHVIYNVKTKLYVLWINVYDNRVGYRVFTSKTPVGPFKEVGEPHLAVNSDMPVAGLNNGDHDTFIDDDGTAYLAFTDWRTKGSLVIEKLSADYLTGTGEFVKGITGGETEAPALFKRKGIYYVIYSDPNCGYCSGTGTSYRTAKSPLGPWSTATKISDNSCGGQPSFVSTIKINSKTVYLYGSDLWNNAAKNEALANFYWAPLKFAADGSINPLKCFEEYKLPKSTLAATSGQLDFSLKGDINRDTARAQSFTVKRTGKLTELDITVFKNNYPNAELIIELYKTNNLAQPTGSALASYAMAAGCIGWSAKKIAFKPSVQVIKGLRYVFVLKTTSAKGCYGVAYIDLLKYNGENELLSTDGGKTFIKEPNRTMKFQTVVIK